MAGWQIRGAGVDQSAVIFGDRRIFLSFSLTGSWLARHVTTSCNKTKTRRSREMVMVYVLWRRRYMVQHGDMKGGRRMWYDGEVAGSGTACLLVLVV